jgi:2-(1,2-epoxy-1,2-dihydrophenyl)acetyl-CoA isomerase
VLQIVSARKGNVVMDREAVIRVDRKGLVQCMTIQGPKGNALNLPMVQELIQAIRSAAQDPGTRCLLLTGAGDVFCSGQDLEVFQGPPEQVRVRWHLEHSYNALILSMRRIEKPILAAINGPAAGAGLGIALAADLRLAAERARFVFGFSRVGLTADSGVSLLLPALVGLGRASEMAFTNQPLSARQALEQGLVNRVCPDPELQSAAAELAHSLASGPTEAYGLTKRAFNRAILPHLASTLDYEAVLQGIAAHTSDHQEGVQAFFEKRKPNFRGA